MLKHWKELLGAGQAPGSAGNSSLAQKTPGVGPPPQSRQRSEGVQKRQSPGLEQFFSSIRDQENLSILDLAGASQANISFITNLGHRIYSDDIIRTLEAAFGGPGDFYENQADPERVRKFMSGTLDFPEQSFGGALVWDTLQFLAPSLLHDTVEQLYNVLRPDLQLPHRGRQDHPADFARDARARPVFQQPGPRKTVLAVSIAQVFSDPGCAARSHREALAARLEPPLQ